MKRIGRIVLLMSVASAAPAQLIEEGLILDLDADRGVTLKDGGRVAICAKLDGQDRIILQVSDNGVGIDPERLSQVLQPFSQADSSLGRKYEGSGLGLALADKLVNLHGAELYIDSEVGAGTTVTIIFPRERTLRRVSASRVA